MLSILVTHSYFLRFDPKQLARAKPYPPLATLQVASLLRKAGHRVALFDAMLAAGPSELEHALRAERPQLVLLYEDNFNYLSKMCLARMRRAACEMIAAARRHGAHVIAGGPDETDEPEPYLKAGADVVLVGEGLSALEQLVARLDASSSAAPRPNTARALAAGAAAPLAGVPGTAWLVHGNVVRRASALGPRESPRPVQPAWDLVDIEHYRRLWRDAHGYFSLNMAASRGCSFRCAWCAKPIWGNRYLQRDAVAVADEMIELKRRFEPDHIWFADDIFGFRVDWVRDFAERVVAAGGPVPFTIQTRADLLSARMAAALKAAGCREAWLGAESGSQRILNAMHKGLEVAEILTARARLRAAGIRTGFFIQLGYLGERFEDILATRRLIELARPDDIGVSVSYPLPGTKFYELVKHQLAERTHWEASDDLAMMFHGTYTSEFYREVRDLLHAQVAIEAMRARGELAAYARARHALEERWTSLTAHERELRNPAGVELAAIRASESRPGAP